MCPPKPEATGTLEANEPRSTTVRTTNGARFFFWVPAAVHGLVVTAPFLLAAVASRFLAALSLPPVAFRAYVAGALCRLVVSVLSRAEGWFRSPITTRHRRERSPPAAGTPPPARRKKAVAVVGAGPSGLVTAKELLEAGHAVTVYESASAIGGEFANRFYPGGKLTSSPYATAFSDFEPRCGERGGTTTTGGPYPHHTKDEYAGYLQEYADHFGVAPHVRLDTAVEDVTGERGAFFVTSATKDGIVATDGPYDHIAVCTGQNRVPAAARCDGASERTLEGFRGTVLHTSDFWKTSRDDPNAAYAALAGKRVVTIGLGEAMADILKIVTTSLSDPPSEVCASVRRGAFVVPRTNPRTGMNNDFDSTRIRYSLPKAWHNWSMHACATLTTRFARTDDPWRDVRSRLLERLGGIPAYVRATKSDAFVDAVLSGSVVLKPAIRRVRGNVVHFVDGTAMEDVDVILCGTGYDFAQTTFPFLEGLASSSSSGAGGKPPASCPTDRLFRMFDPAYGDSVAFVGMGVRPLLGSIPTSAEIQARLLALIVSGERRLPGRADMERAVATDAAHARRDLAPWNEHWRGLVNWIPFMDAVAREVGCLPPWHWIATRPGLWVRLLTGPATAFHYRLTGPGSGGGRAALAESVVRKLPGGSRGLDLAFYAALHACVAMLDWPVFALRLCGRLPVFVASAGRSCVAGLLREWERLRSTIVSFQKLFLPF